MRLRTSEYTPNTLPPALSVAHTVLREHFGAGEFTRAEADKVIMATLGVKLSIADSRYKGLWRVGSIVR